MVSLDITESDWIDNNLYYRLKGEGECWDEILLETGEDFFHSDSTLHRIKTVLRYPLIIRHQAFPCTLD